jgi:hypothetical protein
MPDINLSPYTVEQQAIDRRRRMAELLQQQAAAPMEMPSMPGVRSSPFAGLAKLLQGYGAGQRLENIDTEQKALGEKYQTERTNQFQNLARLLSAPAQAAQFSETIPEQGQGTITKVNETAPARPAGFVPAEALSQFTNPDIQQLAMSRVLSQLEPKPLTHGKEGDVFFNQAGEEVKRIPKSPNWEKFSKFDDKTGVEITGLIDKNAPKPLETFVEGARKPEDLVSVDTTNEQGQPVTRYLKKSDPLLTSGVPKPLVGILGDLQVAGALPPNWKENPAIVDLVNTSFINKVGGITPKDVFNFKVAVADLGIKKATLADQGINAGVAIPSVPMQSTGVLGAIQNRPVSQPAPVIAPAVAPAVVPTAKANRPYTPLNAPQAVSPALEPTAAPAGLSPRDMREIEKQKILSANKDMTETQSNAALFGGSMAQAHATMNQLEKAGTVKNAVIPAMMQSLVGLLPLGVGEKVADQIESIAKTDPIGMFGPDQNQQRLGQAQVAFATAWLRKTSGASFGAAEVANTIKEFFPMRGEGDSVIKQKREARDRAIEGMKLGTTKEGQAYIDRYLGVTPKPAGGGSDPLGLRGK